MRGLRKHESDKFEHFFVTLVQEQADKQNCVFFLDSEEGHNAEDAGMELSDLSGWLIPKERTDEFEDLFMSDSVDDSWIDFFTFVE